MAGEMIVAWPAGTGATVPTVLPQIGSVEPALITGLAATFISNESLEAGQEPVDCEDNTMVIVFAMVVT